jgi:hypothetical protein
MYLVSVASIRLSEYHPYIDPKITLWFKHVRDSNYGLDSPYLSPSYLVVSHRLSRMWHSHNILILTFEVTSLLSICLFQNHCIRDWSYSHDIRRVLLIQKRMILPLASIWGSHTFSRFS